MNPSGPVSMTMIGCGAFARRYHVPALLEDQGVTVAAIVDPTPHPDTIAIRGTLRGAASCRASTTCRKSAPSARARW